MTNPANNAQFTAPATVNLAATASDADGSVVKVEFFNGSTKLGESTNAPYQYTWSNVAADSYALTAKATDNQGATKTSATVNIQVNAPTPPPNPGADLIGPDCVRANDIKAFEVNARNLPNATNFSWWCNGSTQSITPTQPGKATYSFGQWFTGGQVCVGINYSGGSLVPAVLQECNDLCARCPRRGRRRGRRARVPESYTGPLFVRGRPRHSGIERCRRNRPRTAAVGIGAGGSDRHVWRTPVSGDVPVADSIRSPKPARSETAQNGEVNPLRYPAKTRSVIKKLTGVCYICL